jgi:hypothetical protein
MASLLFRLDRQTLPSQNSIQQFDSQKTMLHKILKLRGGNDNRLLQLPYSIEVNEFVVTGTNCVEPKACFDDIFATCTHNKWHTYHQS